MYNVILFGCGKYLEKRKGEIFRYSNRYNIIALSDNNKKLWGESFYNYEVISPSEIITKSFSYVVITSIYFLDIKNQLLSLGIKENAIIEYDRFMIIIKKGIINWYGQKYVNNMKRVLICSNYLNYTGGPMTAIYAAIAFKRMNYAVTIATEKADKTIINEIIKKDICVAEIPAMRYIDKYEVEFAKEYDFILVNTYTQYQCAIKFCEVNPVLWWIHEANILYGDFNLNNYVSKYINSKINIVAVSNVAKNNFEQIFPNRINNIMHYAIPDETVGERRKGKNNKIIFSIIGTVCDRKGTDLFLKAISKLSNTVQAEFWIIGTGSQEYYEQIKPLIDYSSSIIIKGELSRSEMKIALSMIDVVVMPSREDPLPIAVTEGMMSGAACIVSDRCGNKDYIKNGENGFVFPSEDIEALAKIMQYLIDNPALISEVGKKARKTYETVFSMNAFEKKLKHEIKIAIDMFNDR